MSSMHFVVHPLPGTEDQLIDSTTLVDIDDSFTCKECESYKNCDKLDKHYIFIDELYSQIIKVMQLGSKKSVVKFYNNNEGNKRKKVTGWNLHVQKSHQLYRLNFETWALAGTMYDNMVNTHKDFKNRLRWCQRNEETIKLDILAMYRKECNFPKFWKETKKFNYKQSLPIKVNSLHEHAKIADMFANKFKVHPRQTDSELAANSISPSVTPDHPVIQFTPDQITNLVRHMKHGKSPGHDELSVEHVLYGGELLHSKLCNLFNLCLRYSYLPQDLMKTIVIPMPKNKTGYLGSANNYRPISLGTITGKILERL